MLTKKDNLKDNIKNDVKNSKNAKNPSSSHQEHPAGCCQPVSTGTPQQMAKTPQPATKPQSDTQHHDKKTSSKTRITLRYDAGFPNQLYIRGKGANLNWDKGQPLKNTKPDEWVWETDTHFTQCEFKILINDHLYENGDNHLLNAGSTLVYTPHFS